MKKRLEAIQPRCVNHHTDKQLIVNPFFASKISELYFVFLT